MPEQSKTRLSYWRVDGDRDYSAAAIADIVAGEIEFSDKEYAGVRWNRFEPTMEEQEQVEAILMEGKHLVAGVELVIDLVELRGEKPNGDMAATRAAAPGSVAVFIEQDVAA